jgi:hypothetical protein
MSEENSFAAVSDTGPLISTFQSNSFHLLTAIFGVLHTTERCAAELVRHGWDDALAQTGSDLIRHHLTTSEVQIANQMALHIMPPNSVTPMITSARQRRLFLDGARSSRALCCYRMRRLHVRLRGKWV